MNGIMRILKTQTHLENKTYEIFVSGCTIRCPGCHNKEAQTFGNGLTWDTNIIELILDVQSPLIDTVWVLGGEPLDQDIEELCRMLGSIKAMTGKKIVLWTGYSINKAYVDLGISLKYVDYIKCGRYDNRIEEYDYYDEIKSDLLKNQSLYKVEEYKVTLLTPGERNE